MRGADIVAAALNANTLTDAENLQKMIEAAVGARYQRPLADMPNNQGLASTTGSFDHKMLENVTNMQDAVLERLALSQFGNPEAVPFNSPHEAAKALFDGVSREELASRATVEFHESDPPTNISKRITAIFRDYGCGMTPQRIPDTIFGVGRWYKTELDWLQGAFGMGAKSTFGNARAVVLVTRRAPELLCTSDGEEDRIAIAVLLREQHHKTVSAYYLTTTVWAKPGDIAEPYSVPSTDLPTFAPGTHLALVSYGVEGFYRARAGGDDRTFEAVLNTRLYEPVIPIRFTTTLLKDRVRNYNLTGLAKRLEDNPRPDREEGRETLPFNIEGTTYHLNVEGFVFAKPDEPGDRRSFVAHDHAVIFTSNGQAHHHWTPSEFRNLTGLRKLHDRVFVVVKTDELPIEVRTSLFTSDRSGLVRNAHAIRLQDAVASFIGDWEWLKKINGDLIREAIKSTGEERSTIRIAERISRALKLRGFSLGGSSGTSGGGSGVSSGGKVKPPIDLYSDPTILEGPAHIVAEEGKTKWATYTLNATDDFMPRRGELAVTCSHPDIGAREITVGQLRSGHVRISIAVPAGIEHGVYDLNVTLRDWARSSGGVGPTLAWVTKCEIIDEREVKPKGPGKSTGKSGAGEGPNVALVWSSPENQEEWTKKSVGEVQMIKATDLADMQPEYQELKALGEAEVPTLIMNSEYFALKQYLSSRAGNVDLRTLDDCRERYAVGVGVGLLLLDQEEQHRIRVGEPVPDGWVDTSREAIARGVLVMMPEFDALVKEAGLGDT